VFSGSWSNVTETLSLVANSNVKGSVYITISKESSLALPGTGLVANSSSAHLSTNAALDPSAGQKILKSPSVGSFLSSSVAFFNARAGGFADMQFNFTLVNAIGKGESVIFTLPDFSGQNISKLDLRETQTEFNFTVSWRNETKALSFTFLHSIVGNTLVYLTLPASSDLKLPDNGIRSNHPMTVETNAKSGPVEGIPVFFIKPVGGSFCPFAILILNSNAPKEQQVLTCSTLQVGFLSLHSTLVRHQQLTLTLVRQCR